MYIEHFKVFCDLAETQSFSKAAALNQITQSAVSQQIRAMEQRFNVVLVERGKRNFVLTPEGQAMRVAAAEILALYDDLGNRLRASRDVVTGELRVASIYSIGLHELPPRLKTFRNRYPEVEVRVEFRRSIQVYHQVQSGEADIGLVAYPARRTGLTFEIFEEDNMVLIVHPNHPLAKCEGVEVKRLRGEKFISFEPDLPTRKVLDRFLRDKEVEPVHVMEFDNIETVKRAVEIESGVSIVPENTVKKEVEAGLLKAVRLTDAKLSRPLGVITPRNRPRSPALDEFIRALRSGDGGVAA